MTEPMPDKDERGRRFFERLREYVEADLEQLAIDEPAMAERMTEAWRARRFRLMTEADIAKDEKTADLAYRVDLWADDKWSGLSRMHWSLLVDDPTDAADEVRLTMLQNGIGIPDSPAEPFTDSPSDDSSGV